MASSLSLSLLAGMEEDGEYQKMEFPVLYYHSATGYYYDPVWHGDTHTHTHTHSGNIHEYNYGLYMYMNLYF